MSLLAAMNELEAQFGAWARCRNDIRAAIVVGSRARSDHPADEWADLDVAIVTTTASVYHRDTLWLSDIAEVWAVAKDPSGVTYHVLFAGGLDAGIAIIPATPVKLATRLIPALRRVPLRLTLGLGHRIERELQEAAAYTARGYRVLFDKDGDAERFFTLFQASKPVRPRPTADVFAWTINEFWFTAVWTAKHLWRGEIWHARNVGLEDRMKRALLTMLEWHALAASTEPVDTWEGGRFIEEWASEDILVALRRSFAGYDAAGCGQALSAMMQLFADVSAETAQLLGLDAQPLLARNVTAWVERNRPA